MHIVKAGITYFLLVFAAGWILGPIRELWVTPSLGRLAGVLLEAPLMLAAMIFAARWIIRRFDMPDTARARAPVGFVALGLLLAAEAMGALWLRGLSLSDYLANFATASGLLSLLLFLLFAIMPALVGRKRP